MTTYIIDVTQEKIDASNGAKDEGCPARRGINDI